MNLGVQPAYLKRFFFELLEQSRRHQRVPLNEIEDEYLALML